MTNENVDEAVAPDAEAIIARNCEFAALCATALAANKNAVFGILEAAGITTVTVSFDGSGDSGQIEDILAETAAAQSVALPGGMIELAYPSWGRIDVDSRTSSVVDAIETLTYDFLDDTHAGWPNNEGAYGTFRFNVAERTITLDYNERYETSEYTQHVF